MGSFKSVTSVTIINLLDSLDCHHISCVVFVEGVGHQGFGLDLDKKYDML